MPGDLASQLADLQLLVQQLAADHSRVEESRVAIARLQALANTGNVTYGGMLKTTIGPSSIPIGPYRQDVDTTYSLEFTLWIADYQLRIKRAQIHLTPKASRQSTAVTPSGGGSTSGGEGSHTHDIGTATTTTASPNNTDTPSPTTNDPGSGLLTGDSNPDTPHHHTWGSHTHTVAHSHTLSNHTHVSAAVTSAAGSSHTHSTPNHTHTVTLSISESGMAAGLHLYIDGVDRTTALGGPWNAAVTLDITTYLIDSRLIPVTGAHTIKVTSTAAGAIEAVGDIYGVIKAIA